MYTLQQAADAIGIKVRTIREWVKSGKIRAVQSENRRWYIDESEVKRCLHGNKG